jgi:hypothetical protein
MSVKKFVFDFLRRGFIACGVSPLILSILYWILQKTAAVDTLTISQVCVGLCSITILAFIAGGMNAIYQIERLPLMLAILITALLESRRIDRHLSRVIEGKGVYVLFMSEEPSAFFAQNVASLAEKGIVLIVSPHLILSRGIGQGRFYCTARLECKNVYLIRRYYFFHVKKKLLPLRSTAMLY